MIKKTFFFFLPILLFDHSAYAQAEFEGDNFFSYIHEDFNNGKGKKLKDWYNMKELSSATYYAQNRNLNITVTDYIGVHRIELIELKDFSPEFEILGKFDGVLPLGLKWGMKQDEIKTNLGNKHDQHGYSLYYHYDRNADFILFFKNNQEKNELQLNSMSISKAHHFENYEKAKPDLKQFMPNPENYKYIVPIKKATEQPINQPAYKSQVSDICSVLKQLLQESYQNFSSQKKIKEWSADTWQLENKIPGAIFTELKSGVYKVRIKDNLPQGPEANKAMDEWRNKITACLTGYTLKESSLSLFSDNPDEVMNYSWRLSYRQPYVELQREVTGSNKANIFIIVRPK